MKTLLYDPPHMSFSATQHGPNIELSNENRTAYNNAGGTQIVRILDQYGDPVTSATVTTSTGSLGGVLFHSFEGDYITAAGLPGYNYRGSGWYVNANLYSWWDTEDVGGTSVSFSGDGTGIGAGDTVSLSGLIYTINGVPYTAVGGSIIGFEMCSALNGGDTITLIG